MADRTQGTWELFGNTGFETLGVNSRMASSDASMDGEPMSVSSWWPTPYVKRGRANARIDGCGAGYAGGHREVYV